MDPNIFTLYPLDPEDKILNNNSISDETNVEKSDLDTNIDTNIDSKEDHVIIDMEPEIKNRSISNMVKISLLINKNFSTPTLTSTTPPPTIPTPPPTILTTPLPAIPTTPLPTITTVSETSTIKPITPLTTPPTTPTPLIIDTNKFEVNKVANAVANISKKFSNNGQKTFTLARKTFGTGRLSKNRNSSTFTTRRFGTTSFNNSNGRRFGTGSFGYNPNRKSINNTQVDTAV